MFGGNSNWRGPIWMPVNALIIRALLQYYAYYGNNFTIECPTGSGRHMTLYQVAEEIGRTAERNLPERQQRPAGCVRRNREHLRTIRTGKILSCFTSTSTATTAPASGASHQTGWTGVVARMMQQFADHIGRAVSGAGQGCRRAERTCQGCAREVTAQISLQQ